ncbi:MULTISPECIES: HsdR family type I site-specific deoxyribonuclease [Enterococcaceae]|uniref:HsdR family type I site-specific deoxyribonuclease n=1 Tax=Enterococcaceae TaxID=81852 RepID=UPI0010E46818|nr:MULTISPECIES: HsdR family type I site-specific deoxyribonuclease [Enterococcaceae]EAE7185984.1 type I restriction endonuclease subunit R [Listeria monocytogenes]MDT2840996.1 HsdR family type I site-specific deoxyribonuclease [Vagococcus carniphilus]
MGHSEQMIENQFIQILSEKENQWTYRPDLKSEDALWQNFRGHLNRINLSLLEDKLLTDKEFNQVKVEFSRLTGTPFLASQWLRGENGVAQISLEREDGQGITLEAFRNKDISGGTSSYEVVHQVVPDTNRIDRGDVSLLINGLPIIHIELKKESAKDGFMQAYHQIQRYAEDGFFKGIYATTQIMVISNKVDTRYFARPIEDTPEAYKRMKKFLFNWRTEDNQTVPDLFDFTRTVLRIPNAHELISQYTILVDDQKNQKFLMALRPYQIHAIRKIREKAAQHEGGFIWHATGSGKTITSFVATKLLAQNSIGVDRTVMVVDRTDLDAQTQDEFTKFASEYHTGQTSGKTVSNTLIVGIKNQKQLTQKLLSSKNNNTILVTTIQKLSAAMRSAKRESEEKGSNQFEKLRKEHIVFIVDEAHRAVSDEEMRKIKKILPNSTWFGLTGTPIFEENQKQENGTFARTTSQQYGPLLHSYTTKNAMDDGAVLGFQVEYHSLISEEDQEAVVVNVNNGELIDDPFEQEKLLPRELYEKDEYIRKMLQKIFNRRSIVKKFNVKNGFPTMSAILTTHSIQQAKRIYQLLKEMKADGSLFSGQNFDKRHQLIDKDFPRVAITFSTNPDQLEKNKQDDELVAIMEDYAHQFDVSPYQDEKLYNQNINKRLARKEKQYQTDGQWLDFVIVVDRLLTGFDSPTIQTLYVDRELNYQKLLQAFSRTNRIYTGKESGTIVTFRKPFTMKENVQRTFRLFSNEHQDFDQLIPREYEEVKKEFRDLSSLYAQADLDLSENPNDLKTMIAQVSAYQKLEKSYKALRSYDQYEEEAEEFSYVVNQLPQYQGKTENVKVQIKEIIEEEAEMDDDFDNLLQEITFSSQLNATHKDIVDSFYINQLLKAIQDNEKGAVEKFEKEIQQKDPMIQQMYHELKDHLVKTAEDIDITQLKETSIQKEIQKRLQQESDEFGLSLEFLQSAMNEYQKEQATIPYLTHLLDSMSISKEDFETKTGEKYRRRTKVLEERLKQQFEYIQKWKEEL